MNQHRTTILLCIIMALYSCDTPQHDNHDIYINSFNEESNISFWDKVFTDYQVIPLELDSACLGVPGLLKMRAYEGKILICDGYTGSVFLINNDGSLVSHISKIGRGPGEYNMLQSGVFYDSRVYVLADETKVIQYSIEGDYISQTSLGQSAQDFITLKDGDFAFMTPRYEGDNNIEDRIVVMNSLLKPTRRFFPTEYQLYYYGSHFSRVYDQEDEFLYIQPWARIDKCNNNSIITTYHIDLHGKGYPDKLLKSDDWEEIYRIMEDTPEIFYITDAFENESYLLLTICMMSYASESRVGYWLINKADWSSRIEYFEYEGSEMAFMGFPLMLTPDNEVVFICNLAEFNTIMTKDSLRKVANAVLPFSSKNEQIMLICKISN